MAKKKRPATKKEGGQEGDEKEKTSLCEKEDRRKEKDSGEEKSCGQEKGCREESL
jgi:hypothetical protein